MKKSSNITIRVRINEIMEKKLFINARCTGVELVMVMINNTNKKLRKVKSLDSQTVKYYSSWIN